MDRHSAVKHGKYCTLRGRKHTEENRRIIVLQLMGDEDQSIMIEKEAHRRAQDDKRLELE